MEGNGQPLRPLKWYKGLSTHKGRLAAGAFLVEGARAVDQIIGSHPDAVVEILTTVEIPSRYRGYPCRSLSEGQLRSISFAATPQDTMVVVRIPADMYSDHLPDVIGSRLILLEDVQDPGNVGTLIRTAAAFDFSGVVLSEKCADPLAPKCVQSTAGAVLSLWIRRTRNYLDLVERLKQTHYRLVAADLNGRSDASLLRGQARLILALGNEAAGLSPSLLGLADSRFAIPLNRNKAESLNVAIAGALCMYISRED